METRHRDLMGAPVCGLIVGAFQQNTADSGEFHFDSFVRCVTLAIGSYSVVSLWLSWKVRLTQRVPAWILTALLGSSIYYFFIHLLDTVTYAWRFRATQPELSLPVRFKLLPPVHYRLICCHYNGRCACSDSNGHDSLRRFKINQSMA